MSTEAISHEPANPDNVHAEQRFTLLKEKIEAPAGMISESWDKEEETERKAMIDRIEKHYENILSPAERAANIRVILKLPDMKYSYLLWPVYMKLMERVSEEEIQAVYGKNHNIDSNGKALLIRMWDNDGVNAGEGFRDFLAKQKTLGLFTTKDFLGPGVARDFLESQFKSNTFQELRLKELFAIMKSGVLPRFHQVKITDFFSVYLNALPESEKQQREIEWKKLISKEQIRKFVEKYAKERLGKLIGESPDNIDLSEKGKIKFNGNFEMSINNNGSYDITIREKTWSFTDTKMEDLLQVLNPRHRDYVSAMFGIKTMEELMISLNGKRK